MTGNIPNQYEAVKFRLHLDQQWHELAGSVLSVESREETARRIRAAMALAGHKSVAALVAALSDHGSRLGAYRIKALLELRNKPPVRAELDQIADACHLPSEFFTMDFWKAAEAKSVSESVARAEELLSEVRATRLESEAKLVAAAEHLAEVEKLMARAHPEISSESEVATPTRTIEDVTAKVARRRVDKPPKPGRRRRGADARDEGS